MCCLCGRRLKHAAAVIPAGRDHPAGNVGPGCARKAGMLPPRPALFRVKRRAAPKVRGSAQMALVEAA